ncbi:cation:proton antiporter [Labrys wisconsinensis]|uniref:CPA1 family monovalent cation:H+ antiporter n=1 Tax=Labrys wisconsinensis TaxID=425677 RepID=A0ABU0JMW2_9HYPH|nr:cation:proton antiporter [Labrys wisconsinensis]MDQ0474990.1 CPA1 family monovalent cation:H+ antiporter [Labrys wisconsinensis]
MQTFEWIIGLLLAAVLLAALARRIGVPYPTFLAIGGACLAVLPVGPAWTLEPELALALFVAPVLLDAAYDSSPRDMRANWLPIASLVVVAVGITTAVVAVVARWLVPDMPWAVAIALGAIVAPPDAAAAITVLRQVRLPYRILKVLEGESLLNDAAALLVYRLAVGAALAGDFSLRDVAPAFILGVIGSLIAGPVLAWVMTRVIARFSDAPTSIILQFAGTFGVWILAERIGLSGILTIVSYAITVARTAPLRTPARLRVPSYAVWETVVLVLNAFAFVLIGLQLGPIWDRLAPAEHLPSALFALAVLAAVIAARFAWVMSYGAMMRTAIAAFGSSAARPTVRGGLVVSWTGMRGIVTLAAAFALPEALPDGTPFPYRDLILLTAFGVVLGTLVVQGLSLRPLIAALDLGDGNVLAREVGQARAEAYKAALATIEGEESLDARMLRKEYARLLAQADDHPEGRAPSELPADFLRRRAIDAARRRANELRMRGEIGDDAFHILEEEFDWAELSAQTTREA